MQTQSALLSILESQSGDSIIQQDQSDPTTLSPAKANKFFGNTEKKLTEEKLRGKSEISEFIKDQSIDPLFPPPKAAKYLGVTVSTLSVWRCTGRYNIHYVKVGRLVKYRKSALDAFLNRRTIGGEP